MGTGCNRLKQSRAAVMPYDKRGYAFLHTTTAASGRDLVPNMPLRDPAADVLALVSGAADESSQITNCSLQNEMGVCRASIAARVATG